jgi:hypothetical protein
VVDDDMRRPGSATVVAVFLYGCAMVVHLAGRGPGLARRVAVGAGLDMGRAGAAIHRRSGERGKRAVRVLLADYLSRHSADVLRAERNHQPAVFAQRHFVQGMYSCPYQASERLHHFLNSLAFAVAADRTLLWAYCLDDQVLPLKLGSSVPSYPADRRCGSHGIPAQICPRHGNVEGCDQVLTRTGWLGAVSEFAPDAPLTSVFGVPYPTARDILLPRATARDALPDLLLDLGVLERRQSALLASQPAANVLSAAAFKRAQQLFSAGPDFAFGALFNAAFSFVPALESRPDYDPFQASNGAVVSRRIALHTPRKVCTPWLPRASQAPHRVEGIP